MLLHLADGQQIPVEYDSVSTASEVMDQVKAMIGMHLDADGYGIFESSAGGWGRLIPFIVAKSTSIFDIPLLIMMKEYQYDDKEITE